MGSFGIFRFGGCLGAPTAPVPPQSMVARRVGRNGRIGRIGVESRGDRDLEFGKWVRGARESLAGAVSPKAVYPVNLCRFQWDGVASHSTPRTTILHNDNAGRKRYLYRRTNEVRSSGQTRLLRAS